MNLLHKYSLLYKIKIINLYTLQLCQELKYKQHICKHLERKSIFLKLLNFG